VQEAPQTVPDSASRTTGTRGQELARALQSSALLPGLAVFADNSLGRPLGLPSRSSVGCSIA